VSGFDIIYALQDEHFDREEELFSIPVRLGTERALRLGRILHVLSAGFLSVVAGVVFICCLLYQHSLVKPNDLSKVNLAFFTTNGVASVVFGLLTIGDIFW